MGRPATPLQEFSCPACGGSFWAKPWNARRRFCSAECQPRGVHLGPTNSSFRGGVWQRKADGRWFIHCRNGVKERYARAVVEANLRRVLRSDEIVHHLNGDPSDDRLENLHITSRAEHINLHRDELLAARKVAA